MTPAYRLFCKWSRTLHLFLAMLGLLLLLFFAVTGFILNHEDWFGLHEPHRTIRTGELAGELLKEPDRLAVVEKLRADFGAVGALDSFDVEEDSLRVVFKAPGRLTEAVINREAGSMEATYESNGVVGWLVDLHRGKSSGTAWGLLIDFTCCLLLLVGITGVLLWFTVRGRRRLGIVTLGLGLTMYTAILLLSVP